MPKKAKSEAPAFDLSQYREPKHYVEREIEREGQEPLRVTLQDLSIRQTNAIPWSARLPLKDVFEHIAPYVVSWNFEAENIETGELVPVPPPAEVGWEVLEFLPNPVGTSIALWLKTPWAMKAADEKKASSGSPTTTEPPPEQS